MSGINSYELAADGSDFDEVWVNQVTAGLGRVTGDSINPVKGYNYLIWRDGAVYYAQNGATGVVTSNAACHTLTNGLLDDHTSIKFVGGQTYQLTGAINFSDYESPSLYGTPKVAVIFEPADTINAFEFDENQNTVLQDFKIDGSNQVTSGMGLMFTEATGTNYAARNMIRNIEFHSCYIGIGDLNAGTNGSAANLFQDITMFENTLTDIRLNVNGTGFWRFNRCTFDHITTQCTDDYSFRMIGADGVVLDTVTWLMGGAGSKGGALFEDTDFIWMSNCDMEKSGLSGFAFLNGRYGQIDNLRMHESGMRVAAAGEASIRLLGCRDFYLTNTSLNISTGATNDLINIGIDGATESTRISFMGGHLSNSAGYGVYISDASSRLSFQGMNFNDNADDDIVETGTTDYNTYKNCSFLSNVGWTLIGAHNMYDQMVQARSVLDLSGGATNEDIFYANTSCVLAGYWVYYTEASSADVDWAADAVRIGRYQDGVALDDDYFDENISEASKNLGYSTYFNSAALTNHVIAVGDIVTVGTGGGKTGTGEIRVVLSIIENAA